MTAQRILIQGAGRGLGLALVARLLADSQQHRIIATVRRPEHAESLEKLAARYGPDRLRIIPLDITHEDSIARARADIDDIETGLDLLITCAGILHDDSGLWPEKKLADIEPGNLAHSFAVNAAGPLLMIKHFHGLLTHGQRAIMASLSARVGSISDNGLGGWYAYRATKSAQNQFTRTAAIELRRQSRQLICVGLHPGTVATGLSAPFQQRVPAKQLQTPDQAAGHLLNVLAHVTPDDSGHVFDWAGERIPP